MIKRIFIGTPTSFGGRMTIAIVRHKETFPLLKGLPPPALLLTHYINTARGFRPCKEIAETPKYLKNFPPLTNDKGSDYHVSYSSGEKGWYLAINRSRPTSGFTEHRVPMPLQRLLIQLKQKTQCRISSNLPSRALFGQSGSAKRLRDSETTSTLCS